MLCSSRITRTFRWTESARRLVGRSRSRPRSIRRSGRAPRSCGSSVSTTARVFGRVAVSEPRQAAGAALDLALRLHLGYFLAEVLTHPRDPRFAGKAIPVRNLLIVGGLSLLFPALHLVRRRWRRYPFWTDAVWLSLFWLDMAGNSLDLYDRHRHFDLLPHFHGTGAAAIAMRRGFVLSRRRAFWFTNALHALLEAQELATDVLFGTHNVRGWWDTAGDLTAGLLGSGSYLWVGRTTWADRDYVLFHRIADLDRCGNALRELGIGIEQRVDILCADSPAFVYAFFGAIKIGAVPVPTNPLLTPRDLAYILNDSRAAAIVVSASLLPKVLEIRKDVPRLRHVLVTGGDAASGTLSFEQVLASADDELSPADTTPDDACFWLYSSGTTGFPKGAVHLQHDMVYCCDTYGASVLRTSEDDRHFTVSPLFHAYGLGNGVFFPLRAGASTVYKPERPTPELVYSLITQEKPTILFTAPTFYAALLAYPSEGFAYDLSSLRMCVSAGEALPKTLFEQWKARFGLEILDGIGATEMLHIFISNYP